MLPKSVFQMSFGIKILSNICLIRTCFLDLPQRWGFKAFSQKIFALGAVVLQQFFPILPFQKVCQGRLFWNASI